MIPYEELVQNMEQTYAAKTGVTPPEDSDTGLCFRILAGEVYNLLTDLAWLQASLLPQTATGEQLSKLAQEQGLTRLQATRAEGKIKFTNNQSTMLPVQLGAGIRCLTGSEPPVVVETLEEAEIPTAAGSSAEVRARAVEAGTAGNLQPGTVTKLELPNTYIGTVTNTVAFTGGTEVETDEELRARLLEQEARRDNGTNLAFYENTVLNQPGVFSASVQAATPAKGEVTVWLGGKGAPADAAVVQRVQAALEAARELNVTVHVYPAKVQPVLVEMDITAANGCAPEAACTVAQEAVRDCFAQLKVGEEMTLTRLYAAIYRTGMVKEARSEAGIPLPKPAADTLLTLKEG